MSLLDEIRSLARDGFGIDDISAKLKLTGPINRKNIKRIVLDGAYVDQRQGAGECQSDAASGE